MIRSLALQKRLQSDDSTPCLCLRKHAIESAHREFSAALCLQYGRTEAKFTYIEMDEQQISAYDSLQERDFEKTLPVILVRKVPPHVGTQHSLRCKACGMQFPLSV
jgi:hypothetical protein